ncbi:Uncharacterised protein [Shigella flexneri]|nr:Uncharacterised protein [Shigella flexneri]
MVLPNIKGIQPLFIWKNWLNMARLNIIVAALGLSNAHWDLRPDSCVEIK